MKVLARTMLVALALGVLPATVAAQQYPTKPIRMLIGFAPGGGTDIIGRIVASKLSESLKQQILVDNRGGASGQIAAEQLAKAAPDGHTIMMAHIAALSMLPSLIPNLPYDPVRDFAPVSLAAISPNLVTVHPSLPVKSMKELVALAKAHPNQLHYASPGAGTVQHFAGEMLNRQAGVKLVHVPYKGAGPAMVDQIAGHVEMGFDVVPVALPHIKAGKLRVLAVGSENRTSLLPDVPTVTESGIAGFNFSTWWGIVTPSAVNKAILTRLHKETAGVMHDAGIKAKILQNGAEAVGNTPEEFAAFIRSEKDKYALIAKSANIRLR
jgi:tripartite-type tricarboxylate transporter receptor subunit TctC